jgi:ParB-like chromosome segregation protein Spo0J
MIIKSLQSLAVPIDKLTGLPGNPRKGDVDAVAKSLDRFGQRKPIVVRQDDGTIIAGNHTWQAAKQLGWTEIAVAYVGDDDVTASAYALADNRTAELGSYDDEALAAMIATVADVSTELLLSTGWTEPEYAQLIEKLGIVEQSDVDSAFDSLPTGDRDDATQMTFTVTLDQAEMIRGALKQALGDGSIDTESGNTNRNGIALAHIAQGWLNARG